MYLALGEAVKRPNPVNSRAFPSHFDSEGIDVVAGKTSAFRLNGFDEFLDRKAIQMNKRH